MSKAYLAILLCVGVGCGTTESGSLLTSGMSALMTANAAGDGNTDISVELFSGQPTQLIFVDLDAGDTLTATSDGQAMSLAKAQLVTIIVYETTFASDAADEQFTIDLARTIDAGAPSSTVTLPDPFTLGTVPTSQSRAADLTITWSPSGTADQMQWQAQGSCINDASGTLTGDPGTYTIAAGTLVQAGNQAQTTCPVTFQLTRVRAGTLDSHFGDGGTINGQQARTATFTTMP